MNGPEISIITPLYNAEKYFESTFQSVMNQSFKDYEWIIVDDGSVDSSLQLAERLSEGIANIRVIRNKCNGGSASARNLGLRHAKGRYITFLDADDSIDPNYLESQRNFISSNGPLISAGYRRKTADTISEFHVPAVVDYKLALKGNPLSCLTTMFDKEVIGERLFPEDLEKAEDYVFWLDILKEGYVAKGNPEILATYNLRPDTKSSNKLKLIPHMFHIYHKTQGVNWFASWFYVARWAIYGIKKYKGLKR